jgi:hypothetical protein
MEKITQLTPENEAAKADYIKKWIAVGHNTDRLDYNETVDIIHDIQTELLGRKKTPVIVVDNPVLAWIGCHYAVSGTPVKELLSKIEGFIKGEDKIEISSFVSPFIDGSFSASLFSFYDYMFNELKVPIEAEILRKYIIWEKSTKLGMVFPLDDVCFVSQKPLSIKVNESNEIHSDANGPAIEYAGHYAPNVWALDGIVVPQELAETPSHKMTIDQYNDLKNADHRMAFVKKFGIERMLELGTKIDTYENYEKEWWTKSQYEMWDMKVLFPGVNYAPHLKMLNQTTKVWHVEAVSPKCRTLEQAIKERMGNKDLEIISIS